MNDWNQIGKYVFAGIFLVMGLTSLIRRRHSYGGWTGDFYDGEGEVILRGWKAQILNLCVILCGVAILVGFGWFLAALLAFILIRKLVVGLDNS